jgi:hypothetical protein
LPDCGFAARQGAPLIAIERHRSREHGFIQGNSGEELAASAANARHIDLRRRDAARHLEALRDGAGPRNCPRQGADFLCQGGIKPRRPAQAVPKRVARGARLALGGLRTAAGAALVRLAWRLRSLITPAPARPLWAQRIDRELAMIRLRDGARQLLREWRAPPGVNWRSDHFRPLPLPSAFASSCFVLKENARLCKQFLRPWGWQRGKEVKK